MGIEDETDAESYGSTDSFASDPTKTKEPFKDPGAKEGIAETPQP